MTPAASRNASSRPASGSATDAPPGGFVLELREAALGLGANGASHRILVESFQVPRGAFLAIVGRSGAGKTMLLTLLGLLRRPDRVGSFVVRCRRGAADSPATHDIRALWNGRPRASSPPAAELDAIRRRVLGYAFQQGELVPALTVGENVEMPLRLLGIGADEAAACARNALQAVGLPGNFAGRRVSQLSGGQYQRAALARAIVHRPDLVLVDEPTGQLDPKTAEEVFRLLQSFQQHQGITVVVVSHDARMVRRYATHMAVVRRRAIDGSDVGMVSGVFDVNTIRRLQSRKRKP